jgi:hypothetical protein
MDCRDRYAFWLLELVLEPVRALGAGEDARSVTVRAAHGTRRFNVTIDRDGGDYRWSFREVPTPARPQLGPPVEKDSTETLPDPEYAFWDAWTAIQQCA